MGPKGLHGFEFPTAAPRPPTVCLIALFGKMGRKSLNHVKALKSYPVHGGNTSRSGTKWIEVPPPPAAAGVAEMIERGLQNEPKAKFN